MVISCVVYGCQNKETNTDADVIFYNFPHNNLGLMAKWLNALKRSNWTPSRSNYVCSKHFTPADYSDHTTKLLKDDAVPSIFFIPPLKSESPDATDGQGSGSDKENYDNVSEDEEVQELKDCIKGHDSTIFRLKNSIEYLQQELMLNQMPYDHENSRLKEDLKKFYSITEKIVDKKLVDLYVRQMSESRRNSSNPKETVVDILYKNILEGEKLDKSRAGSK